MHMYFWLGIPENNNWNFSLGVPYYIKLVDSIFGGLGFVKLRCAKLNKTVSLL